MGVLMHLEEAHKRKTKDASRGQETPNELCAKMTQGIWCSTGCSLTHKGTVMKGDRCPIGQGLSDKERGWAQAEQCTCSEV